jgi:hypothetical protein
VTIFSLPHGKRWNSAYISLHGSCISPNAQLSCYFNMNVTSYELMRLYNQSDKSEMEYLLYSNKWTETSRPCDIIAYTKIRWYCLYTVLLLLIYSTQRISIFMKYALALNKLTKIILSEFIPQLRSPMTTISINQAVTCSHFVIFLFDVSQCHRRRLEYVACTVFFPVIATPPLNHAVVPSVAIPSSTLPVCVAPLAKLLDIGTRIHLIFFTL